MSKLGSHKIKEVQIVGGFLDGVKFNFSDKLNCIIGARGTGKTSVLEFIRYALNSMPNNPVAKKRIENLVENNLAGGRVELKIETRDGLEYIISRSVGDLPIVMDLNKKATGLTFSPVIFRLDVFSQNEIEDIADQSLSQLVLLESFDQERLMDINAKINQLRASLVANASSMSPLRKQFSELKEKISVLPALTERLKSYEVTDNKDANLLNVAHEQKSIRDREQRLVNELLATYQKAEHCSTKVENFIQNEIQWYQMDELCNGKNYPIIEEIFTELNNCNTIINEKIAEIKIAIKQSLTTTQEIVQKVVLIHQQQDIEFRTLLEKNQEEQQKSAERLRLERQRNELLALKNQYHEIKGNGMRLLNERTDMLQSLKELQVERFAIRFSIVEKLNKILMPSIKVSITQYGGLDKYIDLLADGLKHAGIQHRTVAKKIAQICHPHELINIVKEDGCEELIQKTCINENQAKAVLLHLNDPDFIAELEIVELTDLPKIELNDNGCYKTTETLSTGQKCNTILPILLLDSDRPLFIDQPEDNLDNGFVHNTIVESILKVKENRQLVFVTHNPNIPVLADADNMLVLESDGRHGKVKSSGNVDACKHDIVSLLEGGEEAFKKRKNRYDY